MDSGRKIQVGTDPFGIDKDASQVDLTAPRKRVPYSSISASGLYSHRLPGFSIIADPG